MKSKSRFARTASWIRIRARRAILLTRKTLAAWHEVWCVTITNAILQSLVCFTLGTSAIAVSTYSTACSLTIIAKAITSPLVHIFTACTVTIFWVVQLEILRTCCAVCCIYAFSAIILACQTVIGPIIIKTISTVYKSITNPTSFELSPRITTTNTILQSIWKISTHSAFIYRCTLRTSSITWQTVVLSIIIRSCTTLNYWSTKTCSIIKVWFKWAQTLTATNLIWWFTISTFTSIIITLCTVSRTLFTNVCVVWKWPLTELTLNTCTIRRLVHRKGRLTCSTLTSKI